MRIQRHSFIMQDTAAPSEGLHSAKLGVAMLHRIKTLHADSGRYELLEPPDDTQ
jgi:hypothetical protein